MTEKRTRTPLSKVRIPFFEREFTPVKPTRMRARFKTVDDVVFEVSDSSIVPSTYMNRLIYGSRVNKQQPSDITHPLPNVAADVFEKVMRYCYFHTSKYCDSLLPNEVKEWDDQFMDLDPRQLCELASAAYYLDVKDLIELTCRAIAAIISGKSAEQIRKTFHIENDLAGTIDRVLPTSARRRGREHSPRDTITQADTGDAITQGQGESDMPEHNPAPQKTVDEIIEWIDSTSSKVQKKKKKKRRKDKNPAKKENGNLGNDEEVCELDSSHTVSTEAQIQNRDELSTEIPQPATSNANETSYDQKPVDQRDVASGSDESRAASNPEAVQDVESSNSDIAIVSEKLVNPNPSLSGNGTTRDTETRHISTISEKRNYRELQAARISISRDTDSVEWIRRRSSPEELKVKQENKSREGMSANGECSEGKRTANIQPKTQSHGTESAENGGPNHSERGAPSHVKDVLGPQKDDATMTDVAHIGALQSGEVSAEPFINCPENMDREVEDFQQRLSITEPLSSHRQIPQTHGSRLMHVEQKSSKSYPMKDGEKSWIANGTTHEIPVSPQPTRELESSRRTSLLPATSVRAGLEDAAHNEGRDALFKGPSIPKEALAELLRINSEKEECQKIAAAIDEETARLGAKREKVRDTLAFLNMQERQLRAKYNLSDRFP